MNMKLKSKFLDAVNNRVEALGLNAKRISDGMGGRPYPATVGSFLRGEGVAFLTAIDILVFLGWNAKIEWPANKVEGNGNGRAKRSKSIHQ